jgi:hypothetical protein
MRTLSLFIFFLVLLPVCGDAGELRNQTIPSLSVDVVEYANGSFVNSSKNIFVFNYNLNNNTGIYVLGHVEFFLSYWGVENSRTPEPFTQLKVWIISPLTFSDSAKIASKDANVLQHSNFKSDSLSDVFRSIVVPVSRSLQMAAAWRGDPSFWDRDKRQNWTLVEPKLGPLFGQLSLQGYQLEPEYAGGDGGQKSTYYSSYRKYPSPLSDFRGYYVLAFLFLGALICGISAYYVDNKWPNAGWIPLAIFAFIAAICFGQLYRLSAEFLAPFVAPEDHVTEDLNGVHAIVAETHQARDNRLCINRHVFRPITIGTASLFLLKVAREPLHFPVAVARRVEAAAAMMLGRRHRLRLGAPGRSLR